MKFAFYALSLTLVVFGSKSSYADFKVTTNGSSATVGEKTIQDFSGIQLADGRMIKTEQDIDNWAVGLTNLADFCKDLPNIGQAITDHTIGQANLRLSYKTFVVISDSQKNECGVNSSDYDRHRDCRRLCEIQPSFGVSLPSYGLSKQSTSENPTGVLSLPNGQKFETVDDVQSWVQSVNSKSEFCDAIPYIKNLLEHHIAQSPSGTLDSTWFSVFEGTEKSTCKIVNSSYVRSRGDFPDCQSRCDKK
jgi:hypothetical protein